MQPSNEDRKTFQEHLNTYFKLNFNTCHLCPNLDHHQGLVHMIGCNNRHLLFFNRTFRSIRSENKKAWPPLVSEFGESHFLPKISNWKMLRFYRTELNESVVLALILYRVWKYQCQGDS